MLTPTNVLFLVGETHEQQKRLSRVEGPGVTTPPLTRASSSNITGTPNGNVTMADPILWAKPAFEIELDETTYLPGDVITGRVVRRAGNNGLVSPDVLVQLTFSGATISRQVDQARYKIDPRTSPYDDFTHYRSEIKFVESVQTLHDGPLHIPPGQNPEAAPWEFEIPLPLHPAPTNVTKDQREVSFLSFDPEDVAEETLPFTINDHEKANNNCNAFVEYILTAKIFETRGGAKIPTTATKFITVLPTPVPPIIDWSIARKEVRRSATTHRLSGLNLLNRTKKALSLAHVPYYLFNVQVDYPRTIQIDSVQPVPFLLRIAPARQEDVSGCPTTLLTNMSDNPGLPFILTSLKLRLTATTEVSLPRQRSTSSQDELVGEVDLHRGDFQPLEDLVPPGQHALAIPDASAKPGSSEWEEIMDVGVDDYKEMMDVGKLVGLRFGSREARFMERSARLAAPLYPDLETYNIRHRHVLRWEVTIALAKEVIKVSGEDDVVVVPGHT